jgi:single-strand DNA-binding protein
MSNGLNRVMAIGNLGADPEVRFTSGGQAVCNFRMAVSESWKDKAGQKQERTEWMRIVVWGTLAELCGEHLKKGRQCYVEGKLQTREFTDKENRKQYVTDVVAHSVIFLGGGERGGAGRAEPNEMRGQVEPPTDSDADSIPF